MFMSRTVVLSAKIAATAGAIYLAVTTPALGTTGSVAVGGSSVPPVESPTEDGHPWDRPADGHPWDRLADA